MPKIGPSLMCGDLGSLRREIEILDKGGVDFFHIDIMDGKFVPNFTMGPDLIASIRNDTNIPFDAHLMIENPEKYIDMFAEAGCNMISVHYEAAPHVHRTLQKIKNKGLKAGLALNPDTSIECLEYIYDVVDYVVIMTVNPGFSGQKFIPAMKEKISDVSRLISEKGWDMEIQVDGNISYEVIPEVIDRGADMLVCGTSCLYNQPAGLEKSVGTLANYISDIGQSESTREKGGLPQ